MATVLHAATFMLAMTPWREGSREYLGSSQGASVTFIVSGRRLKELFLKR
jgi:hypothetical protein